MAWKDREQADGYPSSLLLIGCTSSEIYAWTVATTNASSKPIAGSNQGRLVPSQLLDEWRSWLHTAHTYAARCMSACCARVRVLRVAQPDHDRGYAAAPRSRAFTAACPRSRSRSLQPCPALCCARPALRNVAACCPRAAPRPPAAAALFSPACTAAPAFGPTPHSPIPIALRAQPSHGQACLCLRDARRPVHRSDRDGA